MDIYLIIYQKDLNNSKTNNLSAYLRFSFFLLLTIVFACIYDLYTYFAVNIENITVFDVYHEKHRCNKKFGILDKHFN